MAWSLPHLALSQTVSPSLGWFPSQDSFYSRRSYGLGRIPDDGLLKAISQRESMLRSRGFRSQDDDGSAAALDNQWVSIGPTVINSPTRGLVSGRVTSLAVDPTNPSFVYLAAAGGGVWKSSNRGLGWVPLTDNLPSLASGAVAVDPFSGEVWYGTGELNFCRDCYYGAGVYRSPDGGATWNRVASDTFLSSATSLIVFDKQNQGTLFIGRSTALWKSSDGGQSFRTVLLGVITGFVLNPVDSNVAYAAVGNAFGSSENGIYRTSDGGQTWTRLAGGLPAQETIGRIALAVDRNSPSTVYALIARSNDFTLNGLYRTRDGGNTWTNISSFPPEALMEGPFAVGLFNLTVKVDPQNPAVIYAGASDLWKTSDGGNSWRNLLIAEGQHDVVFDPSEPQTFYLINNSGVWKSSDGGQRFASLNQTLAITQFQNVGLHPTNPNLSVGATQDHGTILYGGGFAWDQGRLGDAGTAFYDSMSPQTLYTTGHYFDIFRSDDGGQTWPLLKQTIDPTDRVQFYPPLVVVPGQSVLYFGTQRVWTTGDRGDHWFPVSGDLTGGRSATISALAVSSSTPQVLYAGTSDGLVKVSNDNGRNWAPTAALPNRFVTSIAIHPQLPQFAYVSVSGFGSGHVFRTENSGVSWQDVSSNLPDIPVNCVLIDTHSPDRVYLGTDIGVFVLAPDGSWTPLNQGLPNAIVLGLSQNSTTGLLVAATHGRGAFALATSLNVPYLGALVNSASFNPAPLSPGMSAVLSGGNLASTIATPATPFPLPVSLTNTTVTVNGAPAPLFSVSPTQVNFLVPYGTSGPLAEVTLANAQGQATVRLRRSDVSPGIFQTGADGNVFHSGNIRVSDASPGRAGEELVVYASGLGAVTPTVASGYPAASSTLSTTNTLPVLRVGGVQATVLFSGLAPGMIGVYQVNFVVPSGLNGRVSVVLEMGGTTSNTTYMNVTP
ncbi:MAG: hypothetical protein HYX72_07440 [Acidobacteria bacterium]|nr:hypothetical protein [Acidobacteriota bacterium]